MHIIISYFIAILILLPDIQWFFMSSTEFDFMALSLWLLGGILYIWVIVLIF
ncbi:MULTISPECIES: hypothetical protein [Acidithiobacillus]|uniref:C4-dicarboxylate ABC transporter n=1 Tax=Acidithiobacillus thiooxidans ATCC 19377 TaxID=637390 RepID=A0A5P9XND7_ACITH|nr:MULTISPECIES: hypothetical protein [Acidithiobacillus]MBU2742871.1 hypothetical protein [Acidithiobacillus albertensis]QFX95517.1 C4-dicarboxylate ABC transporter [Acidithiobacillus thiooxidans ATCC 19377]